MGERSHRQMVKRIVFIGAGNVAYHLAPAIERSNAGTIVQVYSRTLASAKALSDRLSSATPVNSTSEIIPDADIYIVSLSDDALGGLIPHLPRNNALWLHTSGSLPMEVLSAMSPRYGVYYPLQTFSKSVELDMEEIPVFVEGCSETVSLEIERFASQTFHRVFHADSTLRRKMHIAAVFACNFTNYMWTIAEDLLHKEGLSLDVLKPLLEETLRKAMQSSPANGQTGPAKRGDRQVMDKHIEMLPPDTAKIYSDLSTAIYNRHHEQN